MKKLLAVFLGISLLIASLSFFETPYLKIQYADAANWAFITRSGSTLYNNSTPLKFAGTNISWLGLDDRQSGKYLNVYPSQFRIDDAFTTAQEMGATVVRSHSLGITVGCALCIEPSLNNFNDTAFNTIDYAIKSAHDHNIRLIIPLVDNWHFPLGGKHTYTSWEGDANEDDFYSNPTVIQDFENHISHILNHVNKYTGIVLKDDPTILAWETGNELDNATSSWDDNWTATIAAYIKSIDANHLIADGHTSVHAKNRNLTSTQLQLANVDMYSGHFYPPLISFLQTDVTNAQQYNKVYFVGEYDWTDSSAIPAQGTISQDSSTSEDGAYSARVDVTTAAQSSSSYFDIQLLSNTFTLQSGQAYTVSFYAKASANNLIQASLQKSGSPFTTYSTKNFTLNSAWNQYSFTYTPSQTLSPVYLPFNLAANIGSIWLDNVSVSSGSGNLISNNSFENTGGNWLSPWKFQLTAPTGYDTLTNFLSSIEGASGISGDLFWSLYGHDDVNGYDHGDMYTLLYPGTSVDYANRAQTLRTHDFKMNGIASLPHHILPAAPVINSITMNGSNVTVDWRGSAGAASYNLMRTTDGVNWTTVKTGLTDTNVPADPSGGGNASYEIVPVSLDGLLGTASNIIPPFSSSISTPSASTTIPTAVPISLPSFSSYTPPQLPITPNPNSVIQPDQQTMHIETSSNQNLKPLSLNVYPTKEISVKIITPDGSPISGIQIAIKEKQKQTTTDHNGQAVFTNIPQGNYAASLTYKNLEGNITFTVPNNPYLKRREVTVVVSIGNILSTQKISLLLKNLLSFMHNKSEI